MSTAPDHDPDIEESAQPDLRVVRETPGTDSDAEIESEDFDEGDIEHANDEEGAPATAQAPLDIRIREAAITAMRDIPAFGRAKASLADCIEYSQNSDWAVSPSGVKRAAHSFATFLAFLVTYPLVDVLGVYREKPVSFVIALLIVIAIGSVLTAVL